MERAVGGDDTVAVERCVRRVDIVVVAAICEDMVGAGDGVDTLVESLVGEVPDEAALVEGVGAHQLPVVVDGAGGVAHRMLVLTLNERLGEVALGSLGHSLVAPGAACVDGVVHGAEDIGAVALAGLLILRGTRGVERLGVAVSVEIVGAHAGLVAHAPGDDGGVVAVALDHAAHTLADSFVELRVLCHGAVAVAHAVTLAVGLVDHINAILVAKLIPLRVIGIVARAHGIDVELLHDGQVALHLLACHDIAAIGAELVAVDALEQHGAAVDQQLAACYLDSAETEGDGGGLGHGAVGVVRRHVEVVEIGGLGAPQAGRCHVERGSR